MVEDVSAVITDFKVYLKKHQKIATVVTTTIIILLLLACVLVMTYKKVSIEVDGSIKTYGTIYNKPEDVLTEYKISLNTYDEYKMSTSTLKNGTTIKVIRAVPVNLTFVGKTEEYYTAKETVGEFVSSLGLKEQNIKFYPAIDTPIVQNQAIKAVLVSYKDEERKEPILYQIVRQADGTLEKGEERILEEGQNGSKKVKIRTISEDNIPVRTEIIGENIISLPKAQVIAVGMRDTIETSRGTVRFKNAKWMEATAYLPTDGGGEGITATGMIARHGIVAVDPEVISLGTRLYIPGYGLALAADTGSAIVGDKIDLCLEDSDEVWQFGRRPIKVYVLE